MIEFLSQQLSTVTINTQIAKQPSYPTIYHRGGCAAWYNPDALDILSWEYARQLLPTKANVTALDLGCSSYLPQALRLAILGCSVDAIDIEPAIPEFHQLNQQLAQRVRYIELDLATLTSEQLQSRYDIIYSNRCLMFSPYATIKRCLQLLVKHAHSSTRLYLAFGSLDSDLGKEYPAMNASLTERFAMPNGPIAKKIDIQQPICLLRDSEIFQLLQDDLNLTIDAQQTGYSAAGSLKVVCYPPSPAVKK